MTNACDHTLQLFELEPLSGLLHMRATLNYRTNAAAGWIDRIQD